MRKYFLSVSVVLAYTILSAQQPQNPAGIVSDIYAPPLYFKPSEKNPTLPRGAEAQMIMQEDGVTCDQWFRLVGDTIIYYRTADNALLDNWGPPIKCSGLKGEFPTVFKIGSTYYMFLKTKQVEGDIYLFSSKDKINWTGMNNGKPSIVHTRDSRDWRFNLFNVGVCVTGSKVHILVEGVGGDKEPRFIPSKLGYAVADISSPVFILTDTPQIMNGANPEMVYVRERNSIVVLYNDYTMSKTNPPNYYSSMRVAKSSLSSDLLDFRSWKVSSLYFPSLSEIQSNIYPADHAIVFTPGKAYPCMLYYNFHQRTGYQAYAPSIHNEADLYESIATTDGNSTIPVVRKIAVNKDEAKYEVDLAGDINITGNYLWNGKPVKFTTYPSDTTISGNYTLSASDFGRTFFVRAEKDVNIVLPSSSTKAFRESRPASVKIIQETPNRVFILPSKGVTVNGETKVWKMKGRYSAVAVFPREPDTYTVISLSER